MSAEQVSSVAGGGMTGSDLGTMTGALQGSINNLVNLGTNYLDRFFPPEKRERWKTWLTEFATQRPYVASFLLSQIALSGLPLVLFGVMSITVLIFAFLAGILVGVVGALLFVVVVLGFALIIFLPTLFFTTSAAVFIWLWGVGTYFIIKWFNQKEVPGIHSDVASGLAKFSGPSDLSGINGNPLGAEGESADPPVPTQHEKTPSKSGEKGSTNSAQHRAEGKENQAHQRKHAANRPSSVGATSKVTGPVDGVPKSVGDTGKAVGI
ncbi:uncharacterized protein Z518_08096 [Rhinocladiella mackenziei CBS 650.93]|uniref:Uncharacterized protein n=1 Tax=Rhinocladiella mackenziei CBS 650.93 TaxID=1442369 RepID=A0A0D2FJN6_9EURO|nr:uncharacterized protein Z518_08096 [Rhinocladiella mackenziei CBS 650.93]KIX02157.1 hypothetical protein Z518_08096 [Rhinocladiella mackenziei CBS 650.93]